MARRRIGRLDQGPTIPLPGIPVLDRKSVFSLAYYNAWVFDTVARSVRTQAFFVSSSPGDEILTAADLAEVTSVIREAISSLPRVRSCVATAIDAHLDPPWGSEGYPSLVFDSKWTVYGYDVAVNGSVSRSQSWFRGAFH
jgi:hypothetical protein